MDTHGSETVRRLATADVLTEVRQRIPLGDSTLDCELVVAQSTASPPLVFLHEGLGSLDLWRDFPATLRALCDPITTLVFSRRGYGTSEPQGRRFDRTYMHEEALSELPALLEALSLNRPLLIGHSDGASIALIHAACGYPVAGIVAIAPHAFVEDRTIAGIRATAETYRKGELRARLQRHHTDVDGLFEAWSDVWLSPEFLSWTIQDDLSSITAPILLVHGTDDAYGTIAQVEAVRNRANGPVESLIIHGAGHAPHFERPDLVLPELVRFVRACSDGLSSSPMPERY